MRNPQRARNRFRQGLSLAEVLISIGVSTLIMLGIANSVAISMKSLDVAAAGPGERSEAARVAQQILEDVRHAKRITERTATAITVIVADRDADAKDETIRYAWSGTPGDPLTREYNGGTAENVAEDVEHLDFNYLYRTVAGS